MSVAAKSGSVVRCQVLVVDDEADLVELLTDVGQSMACRVITAGSVAEARRILAREPIHVMVADVRLPDGDGISLLPTLKQKNPSARAIVITGDPTLTAATTALRHGAIDFVTKPFDARQIIAHLQHAIEKQEQAVHAEQKLRKLKRAVRKLNEARKTISKKVDILCNDLVSAYGELSKQFDVVRTQEAFRKTIMPAHDLEQLICQSMDWMMRQIGYSNVAVWLVGEDGSSQLGAYMKYTVPGDDAVSDAMRRVLLPLAGRDGRDAPVRVEVAALKDKLSPKETELFADQQFLLLDCTYLGESLATLVFFRDQQVPFSDADHETLRAIGPIFAQTLAAIVRGELEEEPDDGPLNADEEEPRREPRREDPKRAKNKKPDPADWWKRGETPPF